MWKFKCNKGTYTNTLERVLRFVFACGYSVKNDDHAEDASRFFVYYKDQYIGAIGKEN